MPFFKSTYNILKKQDEDECFNSNWMNSDKLILPPGGPDDKKNCWDYSREMQIEDVDIWEVILENGGPFGVYAAWCPYEEFYIVMQNWSIVAEFSGWNANGRLEEYLIQLGVSYPKSPDTEIAPFESKIFVAPIAKEINFV